jgi:hypothetical protein
MKAKSARKPKKAAPPPLLIKWHRNDIVEAIQAGVDGYQDPRIDGGKRSNRFKGRGQARVGPTVDSATGWRHGRGLARKQEKGGLHLRHGLFTLADRS